MVLSLTLLFIHMRLTEILNCNDLSGGISLVFFADFFATATSERQLAIYSRHVPGG